MAQKGKAQKLERGGGPRAEGESWFSLRASEAPPAILGPSEAARRLPGPKKPDLPETRAAHF